ncbi:LOW QUALITY PROTEIN: 3-beta-hydroxysteroid-Delta(8),Delta(7)-isomerase [Phoenicopterus ruber ruber]
MATTAPYWPRSLPLPGYVASARPGWQCAGAVAAAGAGLLALGWVLGGEGEGGAARSPARRLALVFLMCAVHGILEGYFSLRHRELPATTGLADVWKEYAKADSRYMTSDDFTVAMETVTAWAWGPLSFLTFLFLRHHPTRYVLQLLVSLGQLWDVLYFATEARAGWSHSDPPLYFWATLGLNGFWVLVPGALLADACHPPGRCPRALDRPRHKPTEPGPLHNAPIPGSQLGDPGWGHSDEFDTGSRLPK